MLFREDRRRSLGLADLLNWGALVGPGTVLNKDGSFLLAWRLRGPDLESAEPAELAALSEGVSHALLPLGDGWLLHADALRVPAAGYPEAGAFPDPVTALIDEERRRDYGRGDSFETHVYLALAWLPPTERTARFLRLLVSGSDRTIRWEEVLADFERRAGDVADELSTRLAVERLEGTALLTYLHTALTGLFHPVRLPPAACYLDVLLASEDLVGGLRPRLGGRHLRVLAVTGFPAATAPGLLSVVSEQAFPLRWSSRFLPLDPHTAAARIARDRRNWLQKRTGVGGLLRQAFAPPAAAAPAPSGNTDADLMAADAEAARALAERGAVRFGDYTPVVVLFDEDEARIEAHSRKLLKEIRHLGFAAREEDLNALEAFRGSLPGHGYPNPRRPLVHTRNLADLLPLTSPWPGEATSPNPYLPPGSPALLYARTAGSTPFRLNLHVSDVGHTLIVGPTGAGKSTLVGLLQAQFFRYEGAQVLTFDKGYSSFPLVAAAGGDHYDLAGERVDRLAFHPLGEIDREAELTWAASWLEACLTLQGAAVGPAQRLSIDRALRLLAGSRGRTLTELLPLLQDRSLRQALAPYTLSGTLGSLLDAAEDGLAEGRFQVFEMSHLMALGDKVVVPVLLYLFHRIERRLNGRPTLIVLEEAWTFLLHDLFAEQLRTWLKELRKRNAAVVLVTQSLADLAGSAHRAVVLESCPTRLLLPAPDAATATSRELYRSIGLSDRQIEIVARATPKRETYDLSPAGRRLFNLSLGPVALAFVGATGKEDLRSIRALQTTFGAGWPAAWLERRGLAEAAEALRAPIPVQEDCHVSA